MAQKKKTKHWSKKKVNNKLFYVIVTIFILLGISTVYLYSIPAIGLPLESQIEYNFQNFLTSLTPAPTQTPTGEPMRTLASGLPNPTDLARIQARPTTAPTEQLPNINFELLRSYQTGTPPGAIAKDVKVTTDSSTINKIYDDIKNLPIMQPGTYNCPAEYANSIIYSLNFYSKGVLTINAIVQTSGCRVVEISPNFKPRMAVGQPGVKLFEDIQQL